jgi:hypothetical protein
MAKKFKTKAPVIIMSLIITLSLVLASTTFVACTFPTELESGTFRFTSRNYNRQ